MKAKDLAALAALGVAGYAAYNKLNEGKDKPKIRGELGSSKSAVEDSAGEYRSQELGKSRSANDGDAGEAEARMPAYKGREANRLDEIQDMYGNKSQSTAEYGPKTLSRQERDVPDRIMGRDAAGSRFTERAAVPVASDAYKKLKAASTKTKTPDLTSVDEVAPQTRAFTPPGVQNSMGAFANAGQADATALGTRAFREATPAQRIAALNEANGAASESAKKTEQLAALSKAKQAQDVAKKRAAGTFVEIPMKKNVTLPADDERFVSPEAGFKPYTTRAGYQAPQGIINYAPTRQVANTREYARQNPQPTIRGMLGLKKGGAVKKMASGGLASSKPSTASSRGDGIAQRGKTKGMIR